MVDQELLTQICAPALTIPTTRYQLVQQSEPLCFQSIGQNVDAGDPDRPLNPAADRSHCAPSGIRSSHCGLRRSRLRSSLCGRLQRDWRSPRAHQLRDTRSPASPAAALPRSVMNAPRLMSNIGAPSSLGRRLASLSHTQSAAERPASPWDRPESF
jgi:hypothetical protein